MPDATDDAPGLPLHRRWWFYPAVVLFVFLALFTAVRARLYALAEAELQRVRVEGFPATPAELDAWYPPTSGCNAADLYVEAAAAWIGDEPLEKRIPGMSSSSPRVDWPRPGEPLPAEMLADLEAYLTLNTAALDALHRAAACPDSRYPVNLRKGFDALLPDLGNLRRSVKLLQLRAMLLAERGRGDEAAGEVVGMFHAAGSLRREPILISALVRASLDTLAGTALEQVLARARISGLRLAEVQAAASAAADPEVAERALAGERVGCLDILRRLGSEDAAALGVNLGWTLPVWRVSGMDDLDRVAYLHMMGAAVRAAGDPILRRTTDFDALQRSMPGYARLSRAVLPALGSAMKTLLQHDAFMRAVAAGIAAERFRLAEGRPPASLAELVPAYLDAVPEDPMDGLPLRYKLEGERAVVYSVGQDGVDQGGVESTPAAERFLNGTDATFTRFERMESDSRH